MLLCLRDSNMKPQSLTFSFTWSKITPQNAISLKFGTVGSKCVDVLNLLQFVEGITNSIFLAEFGLQAHSFENGTEKKSHKEELVHFLTFVEELDQTVIFTVQGLQTFIKMCITLSPSP